MAHKEPITLGDLFLSSREKGYNGLPLLSVTLNNGVVNRETLDRRTETNIDPDSHLLVKKGYIAYNMMRVWQGALGRVHHEGLVSPAYVVLKPTALIDTVYAEYLFKSPRLIYLFWAYSYGITKDRLRLYFNDFAKIPINIPPISEQRKIAQILSAWDKAIITTESLIANSQQQKKSLMQQLLTRKKRFAEFEGEWDLVKLSDCFDNVGGTALEKHVNTDAIHHFISIGNYSIDGKYIDKNQRISLNTKTSTKLLSKNDLVMVLNDKTKTGDIIGSTILINENNKYIYNQRSERLIPHDHIHPIYCWYLLNSKEIRTEVFNRSQGGTQIYVNFSSIKSIKCLLPCFGEQQKIASVLSAADQEIDTLQQKLSHLKQEKKALMQQLLTGKRRVKVDNETEAA